MSNDKIEGLIKKIHDDVDSVVFFKDKFPNPPVRANFGVATIPLKVEAVSTRAKPIKLHRESPEAFREIFAE